MAKMPKGAKLIFNPSSAAPGFMTKNVLSLPGVPSILNSMIENCKRYLVIGLKIHSKTLNLYTVESNISKQLNPKNRIGDYIQSLMDIGSKICKPNIPECDVCPIKTFCNSYKNDLTQIIPLKEKKKSSEKN